MKPKMNLGDLLRERPPPTKLELELLKIFDEVDFQDSIFQGWFHINCYDKDENLRMTIAYRWGSDDWWYYFLTWTGKKWRQKC